MANKNNNSEESWKQKAIQRQVQNKDIRKRLKESKFSRDQWKLKALQHKGTIRKLENEINRIKKNLMKIITQK
jgi:hypothetical protein